MLLLFCADVRPLAEESLFDAALHAVSFARQKKVLQTEDMAARRLSLGGGLLEEAALQRFGKGVYTNLSHSGTTAVCAVSSAKVGVDVEHLRENVDFACVARRYFCQAEQDYLFSAPTDDLAREAFFRLWVLKESFMKATGWGLNLPLNAFCVHVGSPSRIEQQVDAKCYYFYEYRFHDDFLAVCSLLDTTPPQPCWVDLSHLPLIL